MENEFRCDKCGKCCENLNLSHEYDDLNDGTGTCIYFDKDTHLCSIYDRLPDKCNVIKSYQKMRDRLTFNEYLELNYSACRKLKGE